MSTRRQMALHRLLRLAMPRRVRRLRGAEMDETFRRMLQDARAGKGRGLWRLWLREATDLVVTGIRLRWSGVFGGVGRKGAPRGGSGPSGSPGGGGYGRDPFLMDVRFGLRTLRRDPGFALAAVSTLAVGIGATTTVASVADAVLFRPLAYEDPDRVVVVYEGHWPGEEGERPFFPSVRLGTFFDWRARNGVFEDMAHVEAQQLSLTWAGEPRYVHAHRVSANFFDLLGVDASLGRVFSPLEESVDGANIVVLGHSLWATAFQNAPDIVGRTIRLDGVPHTVVGVAPRDFSFDNATLGGTPDLWVNAHVTPEERADRFTLGFLAIARLRDGVTLELARAEMDSVAAALAQELPEANTDRRTGEATGVSVHGVHGDAVLQARRFLTFALAAGAMVLLIACINVGNLLLARATARERELAVRAALGAGRGRVVRQLLAESGLLATIGGVSSLALVYVAVQALQAWGPYPEGPGRLGASIPLLARLSVDARTLAFTSVVCALVVLASGVAPALRGSRTGSLGSVGRGAPMASVRPGRFYRDLLVATEVALAFVLLVGVGLLGTSLARLYDLPIGFDPRGVVAMSAELPQAGYMSERGAVGSPRAQWVVRPEQAELVRDLVQNLESRPEVERASVIHILPFRSRTAGHSGNVHVEGGVPSSSVVDGVARTQDATGRGHNAMLRVAAPGYFAAMGIPMLEGRDFTWSDRAGVPSVAIVDEELAEWYWPGQGAVGRRLQARVGLEWRAVEVVGVVGAVWQDGFSPSGVSRESPPQGAEGSGLRRRQRPGFLYLPYGQPASAYRPFDVPFLTRINVVVRHRGADEAVAAVMAEALRNLDPDVPIVRLESMEASIARSAGDRRFQLLVLGGFSGVALVLALIGVYGVMSFHVNRRVHEIGVRIALGARGVGVVREVVGDGVRVALLGSLLGVAGAMAVTRALSTWLFGVTPTEPSVFLGLGTSMVIVAALASWVPARRAARVDPMDCLRSE